MAHISHVLGVVMLVMATMAAAGKKELKLAECGGADSIITVNSVSDTANPSGPVTFESVLKVDYVSHYNANHDRNHNHKNRNNHNQNRNHDHKKRKNHIRNHHKHHVIHHKSSSHIDLRISIKRWMGFMYVGIPTSIMNKVLRSIENRHTHVNTHNNMLQMSCIEDYCLPNAGAHFKIIRMEEVLSDSRSFAKLLHLLGSGWYKIGIEGWTMHKQKAFCFNVEMKTQF